MIDYHVHTNYSADASATVTEQLEAAAERGLSEICFTDHVDFDNGDKSMQPSDLGALREQLLPYNGLYKGVRIRRGAEVALNDGNCAKKHGGTLRRMTSILLSVQYMLWTDLMFTIRNTTSEKQNRMHTFPIFRRFSQVLKPAIT